MDHRRNHQVNTNQFTLITILFIRVVCRILSIVV